MREHLTVVTRKGQTTVPIEVRKAWGLKQGEKIAVSLPDSTTGTATLTPVRSVTELTFGAFPPRKRPEDLRELREAFIDEVAEQEIAKRTRAGADKRRKVEKGVGQDVDVRG